MVAVEIKLYRVKLTGIANILEYDCGGIEGRFVKMYLQDWIVALIGGRRKSPAKYI